MGRVRPAPAPVGGFDAAATARSGRADSVFVALPGRRWVRLPDRYLDFERRLVQGSLPSPLLWSFVPGTGEVEARTVMAGKEAQAVVVAVRVGTLVAPAAVETIQDGFGRGGTQSRMKIGAVDAHVSAFGPFAVVSWSMGGTVVTAFGKRAQPVFDVVRALDTNRGHPAASLAMPPPDDPKAAFVHLPHFDYADPGPEFVQSWADYLDSVANDPEAPVPSPASFEVRLVQGANATYAGYVLSLSYPWEVVAFGNAVWDSFLQGLADLSSYDRAYLGGRRVYVLDDETQSEVVWAEGTLAIRVFADTLEDAERIATEVIQGRAVFTS